jgi:hypothetical protein
MDKLVSWPAGKGGHYDFCLIANGFFKKFLLFETVIIFFILKNLFLILTYQNNLNI